MSSEAFGKWLAAFGSAWEEYDWQAAADLFTVDATYRRTPFDAPMRGREAIIEYWSKIPDTQNEIKFGYEILTVFENTGIARWQASYVNAQTKLPEELAGIIVARMNSQNLCVKFEEWWHVKDANGWQAR